MEPRGVGTGWFCVAVLCSGAAFVLKEKESGHQSTTQRDDVPEPTGDPTATTGNADKLTTWAVTTPSPPWSRDPLTTPVLTRAGTVGSKTQNAAAVPIRYWSPAIFVVVALLVLFFTYRWTKGEGSRDRADPASDSSDLGALVDIPIHDTAPIIPVPQVSPAVRDPLASPSPCLSFPTAQQRRVMRMLSAAPRAPAASCRRRGGGWRTPQPQKTPKPPSASRTPPHPSLTPLQQPMVPAAPPGAD
ncbi:uncharacterized protein LOC141971443 [Athene noctua]|uniref:uncharacterized protein LOC141971443 n=1 Tax=Athene noctua TaxID=126797 RepID=UPI003EB7B402